MILSVFRFIGPKSRKSKLKKKDAERCLSLIKKGSDTEIFINFHRYNIHNIYLCIVDKTFCNPN